MNRTKFLVLGESFYKLLLITKALKQLACKLQGFNLNILTIFTYRMFQLGQLMLLHQPFIL